MKLSALMTFLTCLVTPFSLTCMDHEIRDRPRSRPVEIEVEFDPPLTEQRAPPVVRLRLTAQRPIPGVNLFLGALSSRDRNDFAAGRHSDALARRQVSTIVWEEGQSAHVAPLVRLAASERYTVFVPAWGWSHVFEVMDQDPLPYLVRAWPPVDAQAGANLAIWCLVEPSTGAVPADDVPSVETLSPGQVPGAMRRGTPAGYGPDCVHWSTGASVPWPALVPPLTAILADGRRARLDPSALRPASGHEPGTEPHCPSGQQRVGPCCARVQDDRLALHCEQDWWLGLSLGQVRWTGHVGPSRPAVVRNLPPDSSLTLSVTALGKSGGRFDWTLDAMTGPPQAHVVINEVMANPAGPEPQQEWVELYNDGAEAAELEGWVLEDAGGSSTLTPCRLDAGQFALVVNDSYDLNSWVDRPPVPGTQVIRVPRLGVDGISNAGEPLRLRSAQGQYESSVPAIPSPKQTVSIARIAPEAPDYLSASFVHQQGGGTPGAPNRD